MGSDYPRRLDLLRRMVGDASRLRDVRDTIPGLDHFSGESVLRFCRVPGREFGWLPALAIHPRRPLDELHLVRHRGLRLKLLWVVLLYC